MKGIINFAHLFPLIPILLSIIGPSGPLSTPATYTPPSLPFPLSPSHLFVLFRFHAFCLLCVRKHPFEILRVWGERAQRGSMGQEKSQKPHTFKKNAASPLPSPTPFLCLFFCSLQVVFSSLCPLSDYFLADEKWGERGRDEKHQLESVMKRQNRRWFRKEMSSLATASRGCMRKWLRSSWKHR